MANISYQSLVLCLGEKPNVDGTIHAELKNRVKTSFSMCWSGAVLVFSGGVTKEGSVSEAQMALEYFTKINQGHIQPTIFLEEKSKSTEDNFRYTAELLLRNGIGVKTVTVVGRRSQLRKARIYAKRVWPNATIQYIAGKDTKPWWYRLLDPTLFAFLAWIGKEAEVQDALFKFGIRR